MQQQFIEYSHAGTVLEGFLANPAQGRANSAPRYWFPTPGPGATTSRSGRAKALAGLGYAAFALDNYGKGVLGANNEENSALIGPFMADRALLRDRLLAGLQTLRAQPGVDPDRIAIMGYCFGGLCALDLARSGADIRGAISFHGLLLPNGLDPRPIKAKVLALHGYADPMVPPEQVRGLRQGDERRGRRLAAARLRRRAARLHGARGERSRLRHGLQRQRRAPLVAGAGEFPRGDLRLRGTRSRAWPAPTPEAGHARDPWVGILPTGACRSGPCPRHLWVGIHADRCGPMHLWVGIHADGLEQDPGGFGCAEPLSG